MYVCMYVCYVCMYVCVCMSTFSKSFSSETTRPIKVKFHMGPPWDGETNVCSTGPGQVTKMVDDLETWYAALSTQVLPSLL